MGGRTIVQRAEPVKARRLPQHAEGWQIPYESGKLRQTGSHRDP
jgi:hypothetical protein